MIIFQCPIPWKTISFIHVDRIKDTGERLN